MLVDNCSTARSAVAVVTDGWLQLRERGPPAVDAQSLLGEDFGIEEVEASPPPTFFAAKLKRWRSCFRACSTAECRRRGSWCCGCCRCGRLGTSIVLLLAFVIVAGSAALYFKRTEAPQWLQKLGGKNGYLYSAGMLPVDLVSYDVHMGGFCLGKTVGDSHAKVGSLRVALIKRSRGPWPAHGAFDVLALDDQASHWGRLQQIWTKSSRLEKLQCANTVEVIDMQKIAPPDNVSMLFVDIGITERFYHQWHLVLVANNVDIAANASMAYEIVGFQALSQWRAGDFSPAACPHDHVRDVSDWIYRYVA
mmetsp:Transcript_91493/g.261958  ORF Transcript_91493/g.261958 Transcript_91493/m.261958 type:complete len:307 (+) Transcript_91493:149-1069(+)